jgi:LysM repeat protein/ABC-type branched-subunit amino acid transport system substrate-binding protein
LHQSIILFLMTGIIKLQHFVLVILILLVSMLRPLNAQTEPPPVEKSTEKVLYQGKVYMLHTVKKGQTLFSICRVYNTTTQELAIANQGVSLNPLPAGQVLRIPLSTKPENKTEISQNQVKEDFIYHVVQTKETPYSLHLKYNIPVEEIYRLNAGADQGLHTGQTIRIPKNNSTQNEKMDLQVNSGNNKTYKIKLGDTLYNIAMSYGVSVSDLINANESLRWGLKPGLVIIIPGKSNLQVNSTQTRKDTSFFAHGFSKLSKSDCDSISTSRSGKTIKVAAILPFYASGSFETDTLLSNDSIDDNDARSKNVVFKGIGAIEFYEGILLAMDSLKKAGTTIDLYAYDDEGDTNKTKQIIKEFETIKPDLILGPLNIDDVRLVSNYSRRTSTIFVPPLMKDDSVVIQNPYLFQPTPSSSTEMNSCAFYLSQYKGQNFILVHETSPLRQEGLEQFKALLKKHLTPEIVNDSTDFKEVLIDGSMQNNIKSALRSDLKNIVIIVSSQEPNVSNVLTQLYTYNRYFEIAVFGLPSWQKFKNVRIDYLHDLQVTLYSPFFVDYNNELVKSFIRSCRSKLGYEPYKTTAKGTGLNFTYFGYDLTFYFINMIKNYGKDAVLCTENYNPPLLLSNYKFEQNPLTGCWENYNLNLIQYKKDFSVEKSEYKLPPSY